MKHEIVGRPDFAMLQLLLEPGESIRAESGAMVSMDSTLELETKAQGGILAGIKRMIGGESFFVNTFRAGNQPGRLHLAPGSPGDLHGMELAEGESWMLQSGAYVAGGTSVEVDTKWGGARTFFGGEGLFMLRVTGPGPLFFGSYGALEVLDIDGEMVVDTGAIVAFDEGLDYRVETVGGLKSLLFSGEGLVCRFHGRGRLYIQTRLPAPLAAFLHPFRPVKQESSDD